MSTIALRLQGIKRRIESVSEGRHVDLVAVSKGHSAEAVRAAAEAGQTAFGESYAREGCEKAGRLRDLDLEWHFIGPIQSNKTAEIAHGFAWVHGVDRVKIARRLADARGFSAPPLNICLQVNISGEVTKSGVPPGELLDLAEQVRQFPALRVRGLMTIPEPGDATRLRAQFSAMKTLWDELRARGFGFDTLSMGMSDDFELAIANGSTLVRIGTAIFGPRGSTP